MKNGFGFFRRFLSAALEVEDDLVDVLLEKSLAKCDCPEANCLLHNSFATAHNSLHNLACLLCTTSSQLAEYLSVLTTNERIIFTHNSKASYLAFQYLLSSPWSNLWEILTEAFSKNASLSLQLFQIFNLRSINPSDFTNQQHQKGLFDCLVTSPTLPPTPSPFNPHSPTYFPTQPSTPNLSTKHLKYLFVHLQLIQQRRFLHTTPLNWTGNAEASKAFFAPFGFQHDLIYIVSNFRDSAVICF